MRWKTLVRASCVRNLVEFILHPTFRENGMSPLVSLVYISPLVFFPSNFLQIQITQKIWGILSLFPSYFLSCRLTLMFEVIPLWKGWEIAQREKEKRMAIDTDCLVSLLRSVFWVKSPMHYSIANFCWSFFPRTFGDYRAVPVFNLNKRCKIFAKPVG